jgi:putative inorganic carbon (hco3(-)) transporter
MPLRSLAFLAFLAGSLAASLVYPMAGVICYLVLYHVYPETTWWGKSLAFLQLRYAFLCGLLLSVGATLNLNRLKFGRHFMRPVEVGMLFVFLTIALSATTGLGWHDRTEEFLDKMAKVFVFVFLMAHVAVTRQRLWHLALTLAVMALYLGHEAHVAPRGAFEGNRLNGIGGPDFHDSNGLSIHLCALLPFVLVVFRQKGVFYKVLSFLAGGYTVNAIILCRTRSVAVAGASVAALSVFYAPRRHRWRIMAVLCLGLVGVAYLSDASYWERVSTIVSTGAQRDASISGRLTLWAGAYQMVKDHPLGVGVGHFEDQISRYVHDPNLERRDAHNSYLVCAAETGIPGLLAYLATLGIAWVSLGRSARLVRSRLSDRSFFELMIFANRASILVYAIAGLFSSRF